MRSLLDLYRRLIGAQVRAQLQYRTAFLLDLIGNGLGTAIWFFSLALILQRFEGVGGWGEPTRAMAPSSAKNRVFTILR